MDGVFFDDRVLVGLGADPIEALPADERTAAQADQKHGVVVNGKKHALWYAQGLFDHNDVDEDEGDDGGADRQNGGNSDGDNDPLVQRPLGSRS